MRWEIFFAIIKFSNPYGTDITISVKNKQNILRKLIPWAEDFATILSIFKSVLNTAFLDQCLVLIENKIPIFRNQFLVLIEDKNGLLFHLSILYTYCHLLKIKLF